MLSFKTLASLVSEIWAKVLHVLKLFMLISNLFKPEGGNPLWPKFSQVVCLLLISMCEVTSIWLSSQLITLDRQTVTPSTHLCQSVKQSLYSCIDLGGKVLTLLNNFRCSENSTISGEIGAYCLKRKTYWGKLVPCLPDPYYYTGIVKGLMKSQNLHHNDYHQTTHIIHTPKKSTLSDYLQTLASPLALSLG